MYTHLFVHLNIKSVGHLIVLKKNKQEDKRKMLQQYRHQITVTRQSSAQELHANTSLCRIYCERKIMCCTADVHLGNTKVLFFQLVFQKE